MFKSQGQVLHDTSAKKGKFISRKKIKFKSIEHSVEIWAFSVTQILREINFGYFRSAKSAILITITALDKSLLTSA